MNRLSNKTIPLLSELNSSHTINSIRNLVWLYFWLLIFEGALRKWILPQLSTPLLVIRDPVAIWIIIKSYRNNIIKFNGYLFSVFIATIISVPLAVYLGHGNFWVAIYGARIYLLHFPLIFIIGKIFTLYDVIKLGKAITYLIIPTTALLVAQFYSPQSSFVNRGIGGDINGAGFGGNETDFYRPPGLFSFTAGNVMYCSLAICFVFNYWISEKKYINRNLLIASTVALFISIPISLSRTLIFQLFISIALVFIAFRQNPKVIWSLIVFIFVLGILTLILSNFSFFSTATGALFNRFSDAGEQEGGVQGTIVDRFLGGLLDTFIGERGETLPFFGYGVGLGTNAGAGILTGEAQFLIAEVEWQRIIGEQGFLLGSVIIIARVTLGVDLLFKAYKKIATNNLLPWCLMSFAFLSILQNQLGPPYSLGFTVIGAGLSMAALNE